jgi:hypothetical protein
MEVVVLEYVSSDSQVAYILTKPLAKGKFKMFRERLNLVENTFLSKRTIFSRTRFIWK